MIESGESSVIPTNGLMPMIEDHLDQYVGSEPTALVFTSSEGFPLRRTKFRHRWAAACAATGVTGLHFHDLRGSGATWAATTGATVRELMSRLGHTTPTVALRYQHATLERDRAIADRLGALFGAAAEAPSEPVAEVTPIGNTIAR